MYIHKTLLINDTLEGDRDQSYDAYPERIAYRLLCIKANQYIDRYEPVTDISV